MFILFYKIKKIKLKENFHIIRGITMTIIILCISAFVLVIYIVIHGIIAFVNYNIIGYYLYFLIIPIDVTLIGIIVSDYIVYVKIWLFR